jgi:hypothetical protein
MKRYIKLYEDFIPNEEDGVDSWDIPTSSNCAIETITLFDSEGGKTTYHQSEEEGFLVGDAFYNSNYNNGYQYDLKRQWIDSSLGNMVVNYLDKNHKYLKDIEKIVVELLPEGGKKTFNLEYLFNGRDYELVNKRYLPLK